MPVFSSATPSAPCPSGASTRGVTFFSIASSPRLINIVISWPLCSPIKSWASFVSATSVFKPSAEKANIESPIFSQAAAAGESGATPTIVTRTSRVFKPELPSTAPGKPYQKPKDKITAANKKFIATPAKTTPILAATDLDEKLSGSPRPSPSSPYIFTKPPRGIILSENSVPFFKKEKTLGGNPSPNSSTLMPARRAATKCPSSCTNISKAKRARNIIIARMIIIYKLNLQNLFFFFIAQIFYFFVVEFIHCFLNPLFGAEEIVFSDFAVFFHFLRALNRRFPLSAQGDARFFRFLV